jgi:hypothetical protein
MNVYDIGDRVRLTASFTDASSVAADPTGITCQVSRRQIPNSTTTYVYSSTITRTGAGVYYVEVTPSAEGVWDYRFVGTGSVIAAGEGSFLVRYSPLVS